MIIIQYICYCRFRWRKRVIKFTNAGTPLNIVNQPQHIDDCYGQRTCQPYYNHHPQIPNMKIMATAQTPYSACICNATKRLWSVDSYKQICNCFFFYNFFFIGVSFYLLNTMGFAHCCRRWQRISCIKHYLASCRNSSMIGNYTTLYLLAVKNYYKNTHNKN